MILDMEIVSLEHHRRRTAHFDPQMLLCSEFGAYTQVLGGDQKATLAKVEGAAGNGTSHFFPVSPSLLTNADRIVVQGKRTSGEVEYVALKYENEIYVSVGSDHCDRQAESFSIPKSKQLCSKVIARQMILYRELRPYRDEISLRSFVHSLDRQIPYQHGALADLMRLGSLLRNCPLNLDINGAVLFSGTIPTITDIPAFTTHFYFQLELPRLHFSIAHDYAIEVLPEAV